MKQLSILLIIFLLLPLACASDKKINFVFNCNEATTSLEHLICAEPQLAQLVKKMNKAYIKKKKFSSAIELVSFERDQKSWLHNRSNECKLKPTSTNPKPIIYCLIESYKNRITDIQETEQSRMAYYKRSLSNTRFSPYERKKWRKLVKWPDSCEFENFEFMDKSGLEFYRIAENHHILFVRCEHYIDTEKNRMYLINTSSSKVTSSAFDFSQVKFENNTWSFYKSNYITGQIYYYPQDKTFDLYRQYSKEIKCGHKVRYNFILKTNKKPEIKLTKARGNYDCNKNMRIRDWPEINVNG